MAKSSFLQRRHLIPQKLIPLGPFRGVRDVGDAGAQDPAFLQDCINGLFVDPVNGGAVEARPGFQLVTSSGLESNSAPQGFFGYTDFDAGTNTTRTFCIVGGKVYRQSGSNIWTDVTPAGITINSGAARVHAVPYNGGFIISDGANEPWIASDLTSTPITGTEIEINTAGSAWYAYGKPTVNGGKVFFIVADIAGTKHLSRIAWSEELDAATGYMQSGYTNFWDLIQAPSPAEKLLAIQGTNDGLYYFRNYSIGVVRGAVNADFTTASTHDGIATDVGIVEWAQDVCLARDFIWFIDSANRPCRLRLGSKTVEDLGQQLRHRIWQVRVAAGSGVSQITAPQIAYTADLNKVVMMFLTDSSVTANASKHLYVFDAVTGSYEGRWIPGLASQPASENPTAIRVYALAAVQRNENLSPDDGPATIIIGGANTSGTNGHIWHQTSQKKTYGSVGIFGDSAGAMHFSITPMLAPNDQTTEFHVDEIAIDAVPDSATMSIDYYTPRASSVGQLTMTGITGSDSIQSSHDHGRYVAGLNALGRWFRPVLHWNVAAGSTQYAFERAILKVRGLVASPRAK